MLERHLLVVVAAAGLAAPCGGGGGEKQPPDRLTFVIMAPAVPTIDGIEAAGEWDAATSIPVLGDEFAGSTLFVTNDEQNLYLALRLVGDADLDASDRMVLRFDNTNDDVVTDGDDQFDVSFRGLRDMHCSSEKCGLGDLRDHGKGAVGRAGAASFFEASKPLASGDAHDFALGEGSTVGICLTVFINGVATSFTTFPRECNLKAYAQHRYVDITIVPAVASASSREASPSSAGKRSRHR